MLPHMQAWVIVLLKLLLATVTATGANPPSANPSGFPGTMHGEDIRLFKKLMLTSSQSQNPLHHLHQLQRKSMCTVIAKLPRKLFRQF